MLNYLNQRRMKGEALTRPEICSIAWAAQEAICDVLSAKAVAAAVREQLPTIALVGGVAANRRLRQLLTQRAAEHQIQVCYPSPVYCTDNAAMIGVAAYDKWLAHDWAGWDLNADPRLPLE